MFDNPVSDFLEKFFSSSIGNVLSAIIIIFVTYFINKLFKRFFDRKISNSKFVLEHDPTTYAFLKHGFSGIIFLIGITFAIFKIPTLKDLSFSLFASAGVLALVAGFASQHTFSNIVSGIFITIFKPFRVGDRIYLREIKGIVEDITLRHTSIRTLENTRVIVPNRVIGDEIIENHHIEDEKICKLLFFNIAYDADISKAIQIIRDQAENHPLCIDCRTIEEKNEGKNKVEVFLVKLSDYSIVLRAHVWVNEPDSGYLINWELNKSIKERFDAEGVEIPFPYRTVVYKNDLKD